MRINQLVRSEIYKDETGAGNFKSLLPLLAVAIVGWAVISYIPAISVPMSLESELETVCTDYLGPQNPNRLSKARVKLLKSTVKDTVAKILAEHEWNEKDLVIKVPNIKTVEVRLNYTVVVNVLGMEIKEENVLNMTKKGSSF